MKILTPRISYLPSGRRVATVLAEPTSLPDRKSTRLNSSLVAISYAVFCLKKKSTARPFQASDGVLDPAGAARAGGPDVRDALAGRRDGGDGGFAHHPAGPPTSRGGRRHPD